MNEKNAAKSTVKRINLALQGGGSHGAFTWGVLDRILQEDDIEICGISGTSAGAMNGAMLLSGYANGGREGARQTLRAFWEDVAATSSLMSPWVYSSVVSGFMQSIWESLTRFVSPYQSNPMNINPLKYLLERHLNLEALKDCKQIKLFVTATSVQTGHARVFREHEVDCDVLLASACLPLTFQAVEIGENSYWDGGYMGNPAIWPLFYHTDVSDILLVQINPIYRQETPRTAQAIFERLNEITFNSALIAEMRAINFVTRLIKDHKLDEPRYQDVRMHMIDASQQFAHMDMESKSNARMGFLDVLFEAGRAQADIWIAAHKDDIGSKATVDIANVFLDKNAAQYKD